MRPKADKPEPLKCTFTAEDMAELGQARALADSCKGKKKAEAATIMSHMTKRQHDLVVRWIACRLGGKQIRVTHG